jgi:hypothetical protein
MARWEYNKHGQLVWIDDTHYYIRAHTNPSITQSHFRGRTDAGAVDDAPTWAATEDTNWTQAADTPFRVRFALQETAGAASGTGTYIIQYNRNAAGWNDITTTSSVVKAVDGGSSVDGANIGTSRLSGTGSFGANASEYDETGTLTIANAIPASGWAEEECAVQIVGTDVANNDTIQLRLIAGTATAISVYSQVPSITASVVESRTGVLNKTLPAITSSAASTLALKASVVKTIPTFPLTSASKVFLVGTISKSIGTTSLTSSATIGDPSVNGSLNATIPAITSASSGQLTLGAAVNAAIANVGSSAAGVIKISGSANSQLSAVTASGAAKIDLKAQMASTMVNLSLGSTNKIALTAITSTSLGAFSLSSEGNTFSPILATLSKTIPDFVLTLSAAVYARNLRTIHDKRRPRRNPLIRPGRSGW